MYFFDVDAFGELQRVLLDLDDFELQVCSFGGVEESHVELSDLGARACPFTEDIDHYS